VVDVPLPARAAQNVDALQDLLLQRGTEPFHGRQPASGTPLQLLDVAMPSRREIWRTFGAVRPGSSISSTEAGDRRAALQGAVRAGPVQRLDLLLDGRADAGDLAQPPCPITSSSGSASAGRGLAAPVISACLEAGFAASSDSAGRVRPADPAYGDASSFSARRLTRL
jgi:hypothetical protein